MAFGRWLRVVGSRLDAASLVLGQGSLVSAHKPPCGACARWRQLCGSPLGRRRAAAGLGSRGSTTTLSSRKKGIKKARGFRAARCVAFFAAVGRCGPPRAYSTACVEVL